MPPGAPNGTKRAPKEPPGAPTSRPREPPSTLNRIFRSQILNFQKSSPRRGEIMVFEGGMVGKQVEIRVQMGIGGFVGPSASPSGRLGSFLGLLRAPRGTRWGLKGAQIKRFENSGCHLGPPGAPKWPPRGPQGHQKRCQESPNTFSRPSFDFSNMFPGRRGDPNFSFEKHSKAKKFTLVILR